MAASGSGFWARGSWTVSVRALGVWAAAGATCCDGGVRR